MQAIGLCARNGGINKPRTGRPSRPTLRTPDDPASCQCPGFSPQLVDYYRLAGIQTCPVI